MRQAERAHVPEQGRRATHSQPSPPETQKEQFHQQHNLNGKIDQSKFSEFLFICNL